MNELRRVGDQATHAHSPTEARVPSGLAEGALEPALRPSRLRPAALRRLHAGPSLHCGPNTVSPCAGSFSFPWLHILSEAAQSRPCGRAFPESSCWRCPGTRHPRVCHSMSHVSRHSTLPRNPHAAPQASPRFSPRRLQTAASLHPTHAPEGPPVSASPVTSSTGGGASTSTQPPPCPPHPPHLPPSARSGSPTNARPLPCSKPGKTVPSGKRSRDPRAQTHKQGPSPLKINVPPSTLIASEHGKAHVPR